MQSSLSGLVQSYFTQVLLMTFLVFQLFLYTVHQLAVQNVLLTFVSWAPFWFTSLGDTCKLCNLFFPLFFNGQGSTLFIRSWFCLCLSLKRMNECLRFLQGDRQVVDQLQKSSSLSQFCSNKSHRPHIIKWKEEVTLRTVDVWGLT